MTTDLLDRITHDPKFIGGRPCIRGLRMTVGTVVGLLASGRTIEEILSASPYVERVDVHAALTYAALRSEEKSPVEGFMRLLVDTNLSPTCIGFFASKGVEAVH